MPKFVENENLGLPFSPRFVVTNITPLAAREPYTAADASFKTEIFSISSILMASNASLSTWIPSTTYNTGASFQDDFPRINTDAPCPGNPFAAIEITPGSRPANKVEVLLAWVSTISFEEIVATDPVRFTFFCVP